METKKKPDVSKADADNDKLNRGEVERGETLNGRVGGMTSILSAVQLGRTERDSQSVHRWCTFDLALCEGCGGN